MDALVIPLALATIPLATIAPAGAAPVGSTWSTEAPIPYWIAAGELGPLPDDQEIAAIHAAFATWSSVDCTAVRFVYVGRSAAPLLAVDQQSVVSIVAANWPGEGPVVVQPAEGAAEARTEVDLALDAEGTAWSVAAADGVEALDLQAGLTYAVGALLGLGDAVDPDATMNVARLGDPASRSLSDADVTAVCTQYPATLPGTGELGEPCADRDGCDEGLECVIDAAEAYCAPTCPAGVCPDGYVCLGFEGRRTCAKGGCGCAGSGGLLPGATAVGIAAFAAFRRRSRPSSRLVTAVGISASTK